MDGRREGVTQALPAIPGEGRAAAAQSSANSNTSGNGFALGEELFLTQRLVFSGKRSGFLSSFGWQ